MRLRRVVRMVALGLALAVTVAACGADDSPTADPPTTTEATTTTATTTSAPATPATTATTTISLPAVDGPFAEGRTPLPGFGEVQIRIVEGPDGETIVLCTLLAETPEQRQRGLMEVTDETLGGYDGMLFTYTEDRENGYWMKDTPLPLSIAYLDADGAVVDTADMDPCPAGVERCPGYPPSGRYRQALEVLQGGLEPLGLRVGAATRVEVGGACDARP